MPLAIPVLIYEGTTIFKGAHRKIDVLKYDFRVTEVHRNLKFGMFIIS